MDLYEVNDINLKYKPYFDLVDIYYRDAVFVVYENIYPGKISVAYDREKAGKAFDSFDELPDNIKRKIIEEIL